MPVCIYASETHPSVQSRTQGRRAVRVREGPFHFQCLQTNRYPWQRSGDAITTAAPPLSPTQLSCGRHDSPLNGSSTAMTAVGAIILPSGYSCTVLLPLALPNLPLLPPYLGACR